MKDERNEPNELGGWISFFARVVPQGIRPLRSFTLLLREHCIEHVIQLRHALDTQIEPPSRRKGEQAVHDVVIVRLPGRLDL